MIHVLVVDDEPLVRSGVRMILEGEDDIEVVGEAPDGNEALEQARALAPDVVILDIRMPGLDGIETTRRLLQRANAPLFDLTIARTKIIPGNLCAVPARVSCQLAGTYPLST